MSDSAKRNQADRPTRVVSQPPLFHGGRIIEASHRYGIPAPEWLDLSTGINPSAWPVPAIPPLDWSRLPEESDGLTQAAAHYYFDLNPSVDLNPGVDLNPCFDLNQRVNLNQTVDSRRHTCSQQRPYDETLESGLLPVAGSQAAIQALPQLRAETMGSGQIYILEPCYQEHQHNWRRVGHQVVGISNVNTDVLERADVVILVNPNNPTGSCIPVSTLLLWREQLAARGAWLVVDEAFIDVTPQDSLVPLGSLPGLIVLRSIGKFFCLAGARVGFVFAEPALLAVLNQLLGPWAVAGPSRWVAQQALRDFDWQQQHRRHLIGASARLAALLRQHNVEPVGGCAFFQWMRHPDALNLHDGLAKQGIFTRYFPQWAGLRFGLPGREPCWNRLDSALTQATLALQFSL